MLCTLLLKKKECRSYAALQQFKAAQVQVSSQDDEQSSCHDAVVGTGRTLKGSYRLG